MHSPSIVIVTPALAAANNGNWQTAQRWARMLRPHSRVRLAADWHAGDEDLMIALHARRSALAVAAWRAATPRRPVALVLTGTDLYRDIESDDAARRSLELADALVVLNDLGARRLPLQLRPICHVILQSCGARAPLPRSRRQLQVLMVGHLREEKDPRTYFAAAHALRARDDIRLDHVGAALDPALGDEAHSLAAGQANYRWLGPLPHEATRRRIQRADVLVHASRMEGGANVVVEAMRSGVPVLASRIDGNLGLLGGDYTGTFEVGDAAALAALLLRCRTEAGLLATLRGQLAERAPLFAPEAERARLLAPVAGLLAR
jgi:putative glycosyltransferase (TIGR04348 family)